MLITFLLIMGLVLPGIPWERGSGSASAALATGSKPQSPGLDAARNSALQKLYADLSGGAPFSEEEVDILRRFASGREVGDVEADVVISRALYDYYVAVKRLSREQAEVFNRYRAFVAKRSQDIADLKAQLLDKRKAYAATNTPPTPNVAPSNDLCSGAVVIPSAGPFPHLTPVVADITDATSTQDASLPTCQTNVSRSIWYSFTPSTTATYTISSCASETATTVDDTVLQIYPAMAGCSVALTELPTTDVTDGCADDECVTEALQAVLTTRLDAGTQYFIVVYEFDSTAPLPNNTAVQLKISQLLPPANDTCGSAEALTLNTPVEGRLQAAADDYRLAAGSACFTGIGQVASQARGRDVAYSFTAPSAGSYSIKAYDYSDFSSDLVLYAATTCPTGTAPITVATCLAASNRNQDGSAEEIKCISLTAGQTLTIIVDENLATSGSTFKIEVNQCVQETEPNDTPATANSNLFGLEGAISTATDVDFYSLGVPAASSRVFALVDGAAAGGFDFDLRVTTAVDTIQYDDANNDDGFGSTSPNIAGAIATGAQTFLRVDYFNQSIASEPYRLYAVVQPPIGSATAESEPNETIAQADSAVNNYFSGTLSGPAPSTDEDVFGFTGAAGDLVFVSLDGDPLRNNTPINPALELLDPSGVVVASVNDTAGFSSTTSGAGSLSSLTPFSPSEALTFRIVTPGTYYVRVKIGNAAAGSNGAGDYLLSISKNGAIGGGGVCSFMISPTSQNFTASGGNGSITVTAAVGCAWIATETSDFITITSGSSGSGNGTVQFSVAANPGAARSATITVAGQTFTVDQAGGAPTTFSASGNVTFTTGGAPMPFVRMAFTRLSGTGAIPGPVTTDALGNWTQSGFETGSTYRVTPTRKRFTFTPASRDFSAASTGLNFTGRKNADTTGIFRPTNGALFLKNVNATGFADIVLTYGSPGDIPVSGDWNGDGIDTIGVYRNGDFLLRNSNTNGFADIVVTFGVAGDQPVVGDWDGDGIDTIGIYRNGTFLLRNSNTAGGPEIVFSLGVTGDVGITGDWNGDGMDTAGVFRPSNGALFLKNSNSTGIADIVLTYGIPNDLPVVGDWNADGVDTIGVYRNGDFLLRNSNTNGFADIVFTLGMNGDKPIKGDWDGMT